MTHRNKKPLQDHTEEAIRRAGTIGELERLAGIGPDLASRQAFWTSFMHLAGTAALDVDCAELRKRARTRVCDGTNQ